MVEAIFFCPTIEPEAGAALCDSWRAPALPKKSHQPDAQAKEPAFRIPRLRVGLI